MPKVVDNYVLERSIGKGQFGEVFKGYNKVTNVDIAVKCVKRELLKGKFTELLENEIKVLRTCNNENIIKLYDIKKTANNIYLIMEYCNEGDLSQYIKQKKFLLEEEAVDFLLQILNGFKTLVRNKIMHRDFKLANILKHDGNIKIADFGFSKLLGSDGNGMATTMLGSPLNMAPEVLNNQEYDSKADIWSIGTCFYELLFGKPPFTASNMVELLRNIQNKQILINRKMNNISQVAEDVLRKMLVVDAKKRISWEDLFHHQINFYQEEKLKKDLEKTLQGGELMMNMSKFYIKNNMVIDHPAEIKKKEDLNNFAMQVAKEGPKNDQQQQYKGPLLRKPQEDNNQIRQDQMQKGSSKGQDTGDGEVTDVETQREKEIKAKKRNANRILHERNIYVFLASVAEEAMNNTGIENYDIVGFLLVKKLLQLIDFLKTSLVEKQNVFNLEYWDQFIQTKDYKDIQTYIAKEYDVFKVYFDSIYQKIMQSPKVRSGKIDEKIRSALNNNYKQINNQVLVKVLYEYCRDFIGTFISGKLVDQVNEQQQYYYQMRQPLIHADRVLDCIKLEETFQFDDKNTNQQFNFKQYYESDNLLEIEQLQKQVMVKLDKIK